MRASGRKGALQPETIGRTPAAELRQASHLLLDRDVPGRYEICVRGATMRLCQTKAPNGPSADESEYTTFWVMASSIAPANEAKVGAGKGHEAALRGMSLATQALVRNLSMCAMLYKDGADLTPSGFLRHPGSARKGPIRLESQGAEKVFR